jgi:glutamyl-tRNA reductase
MSLLAVGVSHQTAPVALLEQFAMGADDTVKALHELVGSDHVSEAIVLATCNRVEVFAEVDRFHGGVTDVSRVLARQAGATVEELSPYVTVHYEDQAVAHLFTVAAGLDSMVVGETQVLGQLRNAYALAREQGTVGRAMHPVAQRALRVGKRVHSETGIDKAGASLVSVSLDRAEERIGSLVGRPVLVVGAGSMGALAATTLARRGAAVTVSSRTPAHAERLAASVEGRAAEVVDAELLRLSTRVPDLDARARNEVARTVRRVVDKLLHEPTVRVKELASAPGGVDYADALRALFGLGIDAELAPERANLAEAVTVDPDELRQGGGHA